MGQRRMKDVVRKQFSGAARKLARAMPNRRDIKHGTDRVGRYIRDNPIGAAVGATAIGFFLGMLLPATTLEADRIRDVRRAARDASAEAMQAGREMVIETVWSTLGSRRSNGEG